MTDPLKKEAEKLERIASFNDGSPVSLAMMLLMHAGGSGCDDTASKNDSPCCPTFLSPWSTAFRKLRSLAFLADGLMLIADRWMEGNKEITIRCPDLRITTIRVRPDGARASAGAKEKRKGMRGQEAENRLSVV